MAKPALWVVGMHGMGDCIHQRAVLRQLMERYTVTLETSWAAMYHDLIAEGLKIVRKPVALRTQTKNAEREAALFTPLHRTGPAILIRYGGAEVMRTASKTVLEAMCNATGTDYAAADYRLPAKLPLGWKGELVNAIGPWPPKAVFKPLLVYRPLVARPEWRGSMARNADPAGYAELFAAIRDHFFVVSVADLEPGKEWIVGPRLHADLEFHSGELTFEAMAALFKLADLVFTSSGFAAILAPAVGTPVVSVVGGYEGAGCHASGAKFSQYLGIEPARPCACWTSQCRQQCDKALDVGAEKLRLLTFVAGLGIVDLEDLYGPQRPAAEMFGPPSEEAGGTAPGGRAIPFPYQEAILRQQMGLKA